MHKDPTYIKELPQSDSIFARKANLFFSVEHTEDNTEMNTYILIQVRTNLSNICSSLDNNFTFVSIHLYIVNCRKAGFT